MPTRTRTTRASPIPGRDRNRLIAAYQRRREKTARRRRRRLAGTVQFDPELTQPYSHDVTAYFERQIAPSLGARVGFVFKSEDDLISVVPDPLRPISAYTVPFSFVDVGVGRPHRHERRSDASTLLRRAVGAGRQHALPGDQPVTQNIDTLLALPDGGSVDEQASQQPLVDAGGRQPHLGARSSSR